MALVYRAIWRDEPGDALTRGHTAFAAWLDGKHHFALPDEGLAPKPDGSRVEAVVSRGAADGVTGLRCALHEDTGAQRWTTTLTVLQAPNNRPSYWIDLEVVAADAFRIPQAEPPRLVLDLLDSGRDPRSGFVPVATTPWLWRANDAQLAADLILDPARDIPVIVFTPDADGLDEAEARARRAARKLAGVASVALLYPLAVRDFGEMVGPDLGVWGGAARVYLPGAGNDEAPFRHLLLPRGVIGRDREVAGRIVADRLATAIAARRAPAEYEVVRRALAGGDATRTVHELETLWIEATEESERLRREASAATEERILAILELEDAEREAERQRRTIAYLTRELQGATATSEEQIGTSLPDKAESPGEAIELARLHLTRLAIPPSAAEKASELDSAMESSVWGQKTWRALRALHLYAIDSTSYNGLWDWCETSNHPYALPASPKVIAMSESETAMKMYPDDRLFGIDPRVRGEETITMESHIKIAEGGGQQIPRIYFHDDTKGVTGKVHIGFIGPHRYVRNASTN